MAWQDWVGVVGGLIGLTLGLFTLWDRTLGARRLAIRHVTAHTYRRDGRFADGSPDVGGLDIVVSNDGRLPVNLSRVWFGAARRTATHFLGMDEEWHKVDQLEIAHAIAPAEFDLRLDGYDRRIPPGESLVIHLEDWVSAGVPAGELQTLQHLQRGYMHVLRPAPETAEAVRAIVGYPLGQPGELDVGVEIVDYSGIRWHKISLDYWRHRERTPGHLRTGWMRWVERRPWLMWVEPRLVSWAVSGAANRNGWMRAAVVDATIGWRIGPGVDRRRYRFLPRIWAYGELADLSQNVEQSRRRADLCWKVYQTCKLDHGRPPTRVEFHQALDASTADEFSDLV